MPRLLDSIQFPASLKGLSVNQLETLAGELRNELLSIVSSNGGHLAANLGVVELTIALHYVLDAPKDKLVWDVGHQSYVHKLLTGRLDAMRTVRTMGGLSGFPKPAESEYDCFGAGHSSTSISAALGIACARDLAGETHNVVAVIGDGSLTGGMALEAMNHAGHLAKRLVVVLNDNEMSIAQNVGAMAQYLNRLRMHPALRRVKEDIASGLVRVPVVGRHIVEIVHRLKESVLYLFVPSMLFEEFGFTYVGPVDGHDIRALTRALQEAVRRQKPVLVHVMTRKGKGYAFAEQEPGRFHGTGPFDLSTGESTEPTSIRTFTDVFGAHMVALGSADSRVVAITAAMSDGTGLSQFASAYPGRFFDVGIAEQHAVTLAAGLASRGLRPVVALYSTFAQRAYDQILHDVCLQHLPVTLVLDRAGLVGADGPTHHGVYDIAYLRHMPGITLLAPSNACELRAMLTWSLQQGGPVAIRMPKSEAREVGSVEPVVSGRGVLLRRGHHVAIVSLGSMLSEAEVACELLAHQGYDPTLIGARFAKPIDLGSLLRLSPEHQLVVTVEEHVRQGGFGSAVLEALTDAGSTLQVLRLGLPDDPVEHGPRSALLLKQGLNGSSVARAIVESLGLPRARPGLHVASR